MMSHAKRNSEVIVFCVLAATVASGQKMPWQNTPSAGTDHIPSTVRFDGPGTATIEAGKPQVVEMHFRIQDGFHINSHKPHESNLIPTQLMVVDGNGLNVSAIDFPEGSDVAFSFAPNEKLSVYTGDLTLRAHVRVTPGVHELDGALRYQACDANACLPPRKLPVSISLNAK